MVWTGGDVPWQYSLILGMQFEHKNDPMGSWSLSPLVLCRAAAMVSFAIVKSPNLAAHLQARNPRLVSFLFSSDGVNIAVGHYWSLTGVDHSLLSNSKRWSSSMTVHASESIITDMIFNQMQRVSSQKWIHMHRPGSFCSGLMTEVDVIFGMHSVSTSYVEGITQKASIFGGYLTMMVW